MKMQSWSPSLLDVTEHKRATASAADMLRGIAILCCNIFAISFSGQGKLKERHSIRAPTVVITVYGYFNFAYGLRNHL